MRVFILLLSVLFAASVARAQSPPAPGASGVEVVKYSWNKERIGWEQNPFGGTNENFHQMQFRARAEKRATDAKRSGNSAEAGKLEREAQVATAIVDAERQKKGPARYAFHYKVSVANHGAKAIREIDWDYVFFDAATGQELGRREFTSTEKIDPGKHRELSFLIPSPPTQTISVYSLGKKERVGLLEQVVVVRVLYEDGAVWQATPAP